MLLKLSQRGRSKKQKKQRVIWLKIRLEKNYKHTATCEDPKKSTRKAIPAEKWQQTYEFRLIY